MCPPAQIYTESIFSRKRISCVIVHDHTLVRQGLRRLIEDEPDLEVVSEAANAAEAYSRIFEQQPDVVLADANTMGLPAEVVERSILRQSPESRVLFLGKGDENIRSIDSSSNDSGYVPPHTSAEELVAMVKGSTESAQNRVHEMPRRDTSDSTDNTATPVRKRSLTSREREVLKLLAEGQTVRSAAGVLGLSAKTVDAHKFNLMRKLGIHNKAELVMWAIQKRVVKIPANF